MANFTVVSWSTLSGMTTTKMQQMMDNDQHLKDLVTSSPLGTLGYAKKTADQGSLTASDTAITGLSVTATADSTRVIKITVGLRSLESTVANDVFQVRIKEDGVTVGEFNVYCVAAGVGCGGGGFPTYTTPSSGSHTWSVYIQRVAGTGTGTLRASSTGPATIIVEDIGAV